MFEVHAEYEIDDHWSRTDGLILKAAGKGGGAVAVATGCQYRTIIFTVETFAEASASASGCRSWPASRPRSGRRSVFDVRAEYPFPRGPSGYMDKDAELHRMAGRTSDYAGADAETRLLGWRVGTMDEAAAMRSSLSAATFANVTIREV